MKFNTKILTTLLVLSITHLCASESNTVIRAAFDLGSSSTKFQVSKVDTDHRKIIEDLTPRQMSRWETGLNKDLLESPDGFLSQQALDLQWGILAHLKNIAMELGATEFAGVATAALRKAHNGAGFLEQVRENLNINIQLIDQDEEGRLGLQTAAAVSERPLEGLISWDQGGGSFQISTTINGEAKTYQGPYGVLSIHQMLNEYVPEFDENMDPEACPLPQSILILNFIHKLEENLPPAPEWLIDHTNQHAVGIGAPGMSIFATMEALTGMSTFTQEDVWETLVDLLNNPVKVHDLKEPHLAPSKLALILAVMGHLHLSTIEFQPVTDGATSGILTREDLWHDADTPILEPVTTTL